MSDDYKFNKRVTLCFHYFLGFKKSFESNEEYLFTKEDLIIIFDGLNKLRNLNVKDTAFRDKLIYRELISIQDLKLVDEETIVGVYKQTYLGQAFENEDFGKIKADSINLRAFFFSIHIPPSGKIYLTSQFLGSSGGFSALRRVISNLFPDKSLRFYSINTSFDNLSSINVRDTHITLNSKGKNIDSKNLNQRVAAISIPRSPDDLNLDENVKKDVLPFRKSDPQRAKEAIVKYFGSSLLSFNADDIEACSMIVTTDGKRTFSISLFDDDVGASRILADVKLDEDGNPDFGILEKIAMEILETKILGKIEDV